MLFFSAEIARAIDIFNDGLDACTFSTKMHAAFTSAFLRASAYAYAQNAFFPITNFNGFARWTKAFPCRIFSGRAVLPHLRRRHALDL